MPDFSDQQMSAGHDYLRAHVVCAFDVVGLVIVVVVADLLLLLLLSLLLVLLFS